MVCHGLIDNLTLKSVDLLCLPWFSVLVLNNLSALVQLPSEVHRPLEEVPISEIEILNNFTLV